MLTEEFDEKTAGLVLRHLPTEYQDMVLARIDRQIARDRFTERAQGALKMSSDRNDPTKAAIESDQYGVVMGLAMEEITKIDRVKECMALLSRYQPELYRQLVEESVERLAALAEIATIDWFHEHVNRWVACYRDTCSLVRPYLPEAPRARVRPKRQKV